LSGDHRKMALWRQEQRELTTQERRPDLWEVHLANRPAESSAKSKLKGKKARGE
jgi:tRNA (guanine37-N1)-methyltransferase